MSKSSTVKWHFLKRFFRLQASHHSKGLTQKWALWVLRTLVINWEWRGKWFMLVIMVVGRGLSTKEGKRTGIYIQPVFFLNEICSESCFTSSLVQLFFWTASIWEVEEKVHLYAGYNILLLLVCFYCYIFKRNMYRFPCSYYQFVQALECFIVQKTYWSTSALPCGSPAVHTEGPCVLHMM